MKLISKPDTKKVNYFGIDLVVPRWTKYLATDKNGEITAYNSKPKLDKTSWVFVGRFCFVTDVDLEGQDWRETLMEV